MAHENKADDGVLKVEETLTKAELFIEEHQKNIAIVIGAIVVIVGIFLGYKNFYAAPREKQAQAQIFGAQQYFEKDSFKLALKGDGNNPGFLTVIDEYSGTKAGNLAYYYAGICYLKTGDFNKAIENLENFSADDEFVAPIALGATGDCYLELGKTDKAIDYYIKASKKSENDMTTPLYLMKAGLASEIKGDFKGALEYYTTIKDKYKKSQQATEIDKYIARAELKTK